MAIIKPFRPLKPKSKFAGSVAAPPYDSVSLKEAREILWKNPHSFISVLKPEVNVAPYTRDETLIYGEARALLAEYLEKGIFYREKVPSLYIYRESFMGKSQCGVVGLFSCEEFWSGGIARTEETKSAELSGRIKWIDNLGVQAGPVFLIHRESFRLRNLLKRIIKSAPEYDFFTDDAVRHTVFRISEPALIERIQNLFLRIPRLYIADGNHRTAAACTRERSGYFLGAAVSAKDARTAPYSRLVKFPEAFLKSGTSFIDALSEYFGVFETPLTETIAPEGLLYKKGSGRSGSGAFHALSRKFFGHGQFSAKKVSANKAFSVFPPFSEKRDFVAYYQGKRYELSLKKALYPRYAGIPGVSILDEVVFRNILQIENKEQFVSYVSGARGESFLKEVTARGLFDAALLPRSIPPAAVMRFADSGRVLPPKSVWFYPKFRSGLFLNPLKDFSSLLEKGQDSEGGYTIWL